MGFSTDLVGIMGFPLILVGIMSFSTDFSRYNRIFH